MNKFVKKILLFIYSVKTVVYNKNKMMLIAGETGSMGNVHIKHILSVHSEVKKLIIFNRDEYGSPITQEVIK